MPLAGNVPFYLVFETDRGKMGGNLEAELKKDLDKTEEYIGGYLRDPGFGGAVEQILRDMGASKGKRLRPRLLLLAARYGDGFEADRERFCRLGALVELVHMASLIHDDIVDDAPVRRGLPSVQSKYGKDRAVYAGDLLLSRIVQSLFRDGFIRAGACFGDTVESMCLGELGQMACRFDESVTAEQYMQNIYGKTAALCRLACVAGALESGCGGGTLRNLEQLGIHFGYMFQIRDDLLDFTSDASREGKPARQDFREGIFTLPVIYAMEEERYRLEILHLMQAAREGRFKQEEEARLLKAVASSGGLDRAAADMRAYARRAREAALALPENGVGEVFLGILNKLA